MIDSIALGSGGLVTSRIALGCMGMSEFYALGPDSKPAATIEYAVQSGITMFDTADMYGPFANERLVGRCLRQQRQAVAIATKFGYVRLPDGTRLGLNGRPDYVKRACEGSLKRMGTDYIDLYYLHRVDREVPIEETIGAMAELVREGKVRHIGISEVSVPTLRRAHAVHPIAAVQTEYSLVSRRPEQQLFPALAELGVGFVAYAPLGRGLLTGRFRTHTDIPPNDYRRTTPRFDVANLLSNVCLVDKLVQVATALDCTAAQVALAWVRQKVNTGVILVGTTTTSRLRENINSLHIKIDGANMALLDKIFAMDAAHGDRYPDMSRVDG